MQVPSCKKSEKKIKSSSKMQVPSCKKRKKKIKSSPKMQVLSCKKEELYNRRDLELFMSLAPL
ncbi:hypothetical protein RJ60_04135, partial [Mesotoga sp. B105.6.4]